MIRIGTSGWRYPEWRDGFYRNVPQRLWLSHLAAHVATIEINSSFYRLQPPSHYRKWAAETPPEFTFAVKGPKLITHLKRLRHTENELRTFIDSIALGPKQGPIIWQLPPTLRFDPGLLEDFLATLPPGRHAIEPRHESFRSDAYFDLMHTHNVAHVVSDAPTSPCIEAVTADFAYVRLHGHDAHRPGPSRVPRSLLTHKRAHHVVQRSGHHVESAVHAAFTQRRRHRVRV